MDKSKDVKEVQLLNIFVPLLKKLLSINLKEIEVIDIQESNIEAMYIYSLGEKAGKSTLFNE